MIAPLSLSTFNRALQQVARPIASSDDLDELFGLIGQARIVMLGEASHGTSEFYDWRRAISQRLIRDHRFSFIAVEGDWPDCQRVHRHTTTGQGSARKALEGYRRFPTWMWGNQETLELVQWLRRHNDAMVRGAHFGDRKRPVGFHGLDVYSLHDSMRLVVEYLKRVDPPAAEAARRAYSCFEPFGNDPVDYAQSLRFVPKSCESEVTAALAHIERLESLYSRINPNHTDPSEAYFDATMNARVSRNAEAYYRTMLAGDAASWNVRDRHMMETLELLLEHYGEDSRAIVWAHNTHIGDYHATDMRQAGYVSIGGLARERFGDAAVRLIGFGTHHGTVMAARAWGGDPEVMIVPEAIPGSLEDHLHRFGSPRLIPLRRLSDQMRKDLNMVIGHRAIGVVYEPEHERVGQYVPTRLADRYDAFIFIDESRAVTALDIPADLSEEPEAWPSGL